jgi:hypothetical protein
MDSFKAGDFWEYLPYQWGKTRGGYRTAGRSDQESEEDAKSVEKDLVSEVKNPA